MIATLVLTAALLSPAQNVHTRTDQWVAWRAGLARACPSQHVDLMGDGGYDEFLEAFDSTLSRKQWRAFVHVADIKRQCASEWGGFGCEMSRSLYAAQRLHLIHSGNGVGVDLSPRKWGRSGFIPSTSSAPPRSKAASKTED